MFCPLAGNLHTETVNPPSHLFVNPFSPQAIDPDLCPAGRFIGFIGSASGPETEALLSAFNSDCIFGGVTVK
jgi:hypothetical protein